MNSTWGVRTRATLAILMGLALLAVVFMARSIIPNLIIAGLMAILAGPVINVLHSSALVILLTNANWEAAQSKIDHFGGEELAVELTAKAEKQLAEIATDEAVAAAVREIVRIEQVKL